MKFARTFRPEKRFAGEKKNSSTKFCAWLQKLHDTLKVFQYLPYNYKYVNKSCFRCFFFVCEATAWPEAYVSFFYHIHMYQNHWKRTSFKTYTHVHVHLFAISLILWEGENTCTNVSGYVPFVFISY